MAAVGQAFLNEKRKLLKAKRLAGKLISILRAKELPQLHKDGKRSWKANADNGLGEIVIRTHLPLSERRATEIRKRIAKCRELNDHRIRIVHGWWLGRGVLHMSRQKLEPTSHYKKNPIEVASLADDAQTLASEL